MNNYIENELSQKIYQKMHSNNKEEQEVMVLLALQDHLDLLVRLAHLGLQELLDHLV